MKIKINSYITLENGEKYIVLNETLYQNQKYYLVMGVEGKEPIETKVAIYKEEMEDSDIYLSKVNDSKQIIELTNLLRNK